MDAMESPRAKTTEGPTTIQTSTTESTPLSPNPIDHRQRKRTTSRHELHFMHPNLYLPNQLYLSDPRALSHRRHQTRHHREEEQRTSDDPPTNEKLDKRHKYRRHRSRHDRKSRKQNDAANMTFHKFADLSIQDANNELEAYAADVNDIGMPAATNQTPPSGILDLDSIRLPFVRRMELISPEDVDQLRGQRLREEQAHCDSLSTIASSSHDLSRRLDESYYNLLDQVSTIRSAIRSLQELTSLTNNLHTEFDKNASSILHDGARHKSRFNNFDNQVQLIDNLETRMHAGKKKAFSLETRLDTVRQRIQAWDQRERDWQARVSRRLNILWTIMGAVILMGAVAGLVDTFRSGSSMEMTTADAVIETNGLDPGYRNMSLDSSIGGSKRVRLVPGMCQQSDSRLKLNDDDNECDADDYKHPHDNGGEKCDSKPGTCTREFSFQRWQSGLDEL
ncbi:hypothetical protein FQN57_005535 [Myotisia sp. PD_48]|nr:hypothetical protein FQN57_005535 [Myotisia sp. PD_48]